VSDAPNATARAPPAAAGRGGRFTRALLAVAGADQVRATLLFGSHMVPSPDRHSV
jgi:hypothetical protein